jgi:chromosome segregation protein
MRLKRLELFGFKSFADRTQLDFPHGVTGIVGPNGCGKSNVVDAVRWVLGETRPTSMRGGEMTDVIFKGSTSRPAMSLAEVTLVLDNAGGEIPTHGAEVAITRRVHGSGEGEYEIDGGRVRLKDVKDLLFDTGLGSRGYAVLEQGRIDAVLSANPLDRRAIFEEAAGVSRFRQRRKEAEQRLKKVDQDTERLDDVLRELESRSRSLKIQAGKAERFLEVQTAWRERGVRLGVVQVERLEDRLGELRTILAARHTEGAGHRERRLDLEQDLERREAERAQVAEAADQASRRLGERIAEQSALEERAVQLAARARSAEHSADQETLRWNELEQRRVERQSELARIAQEAEQASAEAERAAAQAEALVGSREEASRRYREARRASEEHSEVVQEWLRQKTAALHEERALAGSLEPLAQRQSAALARREKATQQAADSQRQSDEARQQRAAQAALAEERERVRAELDAAVARGRGEEQRLAAAVQSLSVERASLDSRIAGLLDWEREREFWNEGAARLADAARGKAKDPELARLGQGLAGLLADRLSAPTAYARALDTALGSAAQALVLESPERAVEIAAWLKSKGLGPVQLIAPELLNRGRCEPAPPEMPYGYRDRVIGLLYDQIEVHPDLISVVHVMLCDCLLVQDLDAALGLTEALPGWRLVTPEGDLVSSSGVIAGQKEVTRGAIGRRAQAQELTQARARIDADLASAQQSLAALKLELQRLVAAQREAQETLSQTRAALARAEADQRSSEARVRDQSRNLEEANQQVESLAQERARLEGRLAEVGQRREAAERRFQLENEALQALEAARQAIEQQRDESNREEARARVEATRLAQLAQGLLQRRSVLERAREELDREQSRCAAQGQAQRQLAGEMSVELASLVERQGGLAEERQAAEAALAEAREQERQQRSAIEAARRAADELTRQLERHLSETSELQLEAQRLELALDEILRRLVEDFGIDRAKLAELAPDVVDAEQREALAPAGALEALEAEVQELRRQLDRLGPVNLEAVQELSEVSQRLGFLSEQRKDLANAKAELMEALSTINSESERLFLETFEEIRKHFQTIFRQLFGGGKADIVLLQDQPVLEAGIEISARPPGRETLPIGLLSGGQRTMTALALLFAVFQSRPSPFCVLDEVDAALDDANVGRFLGMLEGFLTSTQFIVVTHNKGTMAACQRLYGVTMETKGVSRRVSVELSEVDAFVPEVTGDAQKAIAARDSARESAGEEEVEVEVDGPGVRSGRPAPARPAWTAAERRDASIDGPSLGSGTPESVREAGEALELEALEAQQGEGEPGGEPQVELQPRPRRGAGRGQKAPASPAD